MDAVLEECQEWERHLLEEVGWAAPITLEQVAREMLEALTATTQREKEAELGDVLAVLFRFAHREGIDLAKATRGSLERNKFRTKLCLEMNGGKVPRDDSHMAILWKSAKEVEKLNRK